MARLDGLLGVSKKRNRFQALQVGGKTHFVGTFATAEEAARAYDDAARAVFGSINLESFTQPSATSPRRHYAESRRGGAPASLTIPTVAWRRIRLRFTLGLMVNEYWFYFELYAQTRMVGRSRTFKITGKTTRKDAKLAAEEEWLASGALHGDSFVLFKGAENAVVDRYTLRDDEDSPTKD